MSVMRDLEDLITIKTQRLDSYKCLFMMCLPMFSVADRCVYQLERYKDKNCGSRIKLVLISGVIFMMIFLDLGEIFGVSEKFLLRTLGEKCAKTVKFLSADIALLCKPKHYCWSNLKLLTSLQTVLNQKPLNVRLTLKLANQPDEKIQTLRIKT